MKNNKVKPFSWVKAVLNNNKTIICTAILGFLGMEGAKDVLNPELIALLQKLFILATGGALAAHGMKGNFKPQYPEKKE